MLGDGVETVLDGGWVLGDGVVTVLDGGWVLDEGRVSDVGWVLGCGMRTSPTPSTNRHFELIKLGAYNRDIIIEF